MMKTIYFDQRAKRDFANFPVAVQDQFNALLNTLRREGYLAIPDAKKIEGYKDLYEMRVSLKGAWRGFYAYLKGSEVVVLHVIRKKTNKTALRDLKTAERRLKYYL